MPQCRIKTHSLIIMMKIKKVVSILLVSIFLSGSFALGMQPEVCTGEPNCPHCAAAVHNMPAAHTDSAGPSGNCCAGSQHRPCDMQSDPATAPAVYLYPRRNAPDLNILAVVISVKSGAGSLLSNATFNRLSPGSLPPLSTPIYIQKSSLLC